MSSYRPLRFLDASARADEIVANDKLGIGTHSQTSELHIKADAPEVRIQDEVSAVTETALRITANSGVVSFQSGVDFTDDSKGDFEFASMGGDTVHMSIDGSTGRVGVGTTAPGKELEVAGTLRLSDGLSNAVDMNVVSSTGLWNETQKLIGPNPGGSTYFGRDVSMSEDGTYLVAGAYGNDDVTTNAGIAYVYVKSGTSWVLQDTLKASDGDVNDYFGYGVAMSSDGTHVVVGAYADEQPSASNGGSAYIFSRSGSTWSQQAKLTASSYAASDYVGYRVSISGDGSIALVSAHGAESAYVYLKPSGSAWTDATEDVVLTASDGTDGDNFGYDVAISSDGTTAVVGALDNGSGSAYVFVTSDGGSTWTQQQQITGTSAGASAVGADFGSGVTVSSDGTYIAIGARYDGDNGEDFGYGSMYVYATTNGGTSWTKQQKLVPSDASVSIKRDARFADKHTLSISSDGSRIIATAERSGVNDGTAYAFQRTGTTWEETQVFYPRDSRRVSDNGEYFGSAVCISPDGTHAVIGAWYDSERGVQAGAAYVFKYDDVKKLAVSGGLRLTDGQSNVVDMTVNRSVSTWGTSKPRISVYDSGDLGTNEYFGVEISISGDGNTMVVGAMTDNSKGAAYVFEKNRSDRIGSWTNVAKLTSSDLATDDDFGRYVHCNQDGSVIVISAQLNDDNGDYSGSAYVFVRPYSGWADGTETAKLRASDAASQDSFGIQCAVSGDGNTVFIGSHGDDDTYSRSGSVYVYVKPSGGWASTTQQNAKIKASDPSTDAFFGRYVGVSRDGSTLCVGAPGANKAYIYEKPVGGWSNTSQEDAKLTSTTGYYGQHPELSSDGSVVVLGDPNHNTNWGIAHVFVRPDNGWTNSSTPTASLTRSAAPNQPQFGYQTCISDDGSIIAVSAHQDEPDFFAVIGAGNSGSVSIFLKPEGGWEDRDVPDALFFAENEGVAAMGFGVGLSLSGDGRTLSVGCHTADALNYSNAGKVQVYELPNDRTDLVLSDATTLRASKYVGGLTTFITYDYTGTGGSTLSTQYEEKTIIGGHRIPVPEEYHELGVANLEIQGYCKWCGEMGVPENIVMKIRLYYGTEENESYVDSAINTDNPGSRMNGAGIPAITYHLNNDSTLESCIISSRFYIPNCPVGYGNSFRFEVRATSNFTGTIYTNRTTRDSNSQNYERGTTNFFMALKVV